MQSSSVLRALALCALVLVGIRQLAPAQGAQGSESSSSRALNYRIEWHSVVAGTALLQYKHTNPGWNIDLSIESAGIVTRLYRVSDKYSVSGDDHFCAASANLDAQEGKKHTTTRLSFNKAQHTVDYHEHDLVKNTEVNKTITVPACTHEVAGALAVLSQIALPPGKSTYMPVTDGKKVVSARVESQAKENVSIDGKTYSAIRYEVFLFDNVLYKRRGRLYIWVTDDAERLPVQFRIALGFPIGNITLELEKEQKL